MMQSGLVAAAAATLLVVVGFAQAEINYEKAKENFEFCAKETGAEEKFEDIVKKQTIPTSEKGICLVECIMRRKNILTEDGKYDIEEGLKYAKKMLEGRPNADEQYEKIKQIINECAEMKRDEGLDKCEWAVKLSTCVKVKATKENIDLIPKETTST